MATTSANEKTIPEIEQKLKIVGGDLSRILYIENCLKQQDIPNDVRRFCHIKLAELYAAKIMYPTAARHLEAAAGCATTYKEKMQLYFNESVLFLKKGDYPAVETAFKKALAQTNEKEKIELKNNLKKEFFTQAEAYIKRERRGTAILIYEAMVALPFLSDGEKSDIMKILHELYLKTGRITDAMRFQKMNNAGKLPAARWDV